MSSKPITLSDCKPGQRFHMIRCDIQGALRRRLLDLGFVPGSSIEVLQRSPLGDPVAYRINHTTIALRKEESAMIYGELKDVT